MARRTKYTPELVTELLDAMELGMTDEDACSVVGINPATFYNWRNTKPEFFENTTRARPKGWKSDLAIIKRAAIEERDWRAAAEHLDRTRSPYRKSQETVLTGPDGAPLMIVLGERSDGPS